VTALNIAIDASRTTVVRWTGTEHYSLQIIRHLIDINTSHQLHLYFRDDPSPDLFPNQHNVTQHVIPFPRAWTHLRFAQQIFRDRPDVTFVPAHTLPFVFPGRAVATVHDLGFKYFPEAHPLDQRLYLDLTTRYSANRARIVLADSQATANDLAWFYGIRPEKTRVVYPGVDPLEIGDVAAVRQTYDLPERYFLFIGTLQPRKNIARLVQAFDLWQEQNPTEGIGLVLAGGQGWLYDPSWTADIPNITLTGYIDETDKGALYAGAIALVFPSLYEGFGFPVLEAMGCGTPVIASNTSSLPELVGDAGLLVDPLDIESIANAMTQIASDEEMRANFIQRGKAQVKQFTWDAAARAALNALTL